MSVLVTGAGRGLGRALAEGLAAEGLTRENAALLAERRFDTVIHCAHSRAKDVDDLALPDYLADGPDLTERMLRLCRRRFILISSVSVYPPEGHDLREGTPIALDAVRGFYGVAKLLSEARARRWAAETGGAATILRLSSLLGPHSPPNVTVRVIEGAEAVPLSADSQFRYVTHDEVRAVIAALLAQTPPPGSVEVFNVAAPDSIRLDEVARLAGRAPRFGSIRYAAPAAPIARAAALAPSLRTPSRERIIAEIARRRGLSVAPSEAAAEE